MSADGLDSERMESVEDICSSLGLGHVPLLAADNRELNRQLQELQVLTSDYDAGTILAPFFYQYNFRFITPRGFKR